MSVGPIVVGVDPGGRDTGIIVRHDSEVIAHQIVNRVEDEHPGHGIGPIYLSAIRLGIREMVEVACRANRWPQCGVVVGVEAVNVPTGFAGGKKRFVAPKDSMALSMAFAAALTADPGAFVVPVGGNGYGALSSYPEVLVSAAERRFGLDREAPQSSRLRHLRSAWDVSLLAAGIWRASGKRLPA